MSNMSHRLPAGAARSLRRLAVAAASCAAVFASAQLTVLQPVFADNVFPVWYPAGVMLYAIGRFGGAAVVGCAMGTFLFNWQLAPWWVAVGIAVGATVSYMLGAAWLKRVGFRGGIDDMPQARQFFLVGVLAAPILSAMNGPLWLMAAGIIPPADGWFAALLWWGGDGVGVIAIAPALYLVPCRAPQAVRTPAQFAVNLAALVAVGVVAAVVFLPGSWVAEQPLPVGYLPVLAICLLSYFLPACVAAMGVFITAVIAGLGTALEAGPFHESGPELGAVLIGLFTGTVGVVTILVLGARGTQLRISAALAAAARDYQLLVDGSPTLICRYRADGRITFANNTLRAFVGPTDTVARLGFAADRETDSVEIACADVGGNPRWLQWTSRSVGTAADGIAEFQAVGVDVTTRRQAEEERRVIERQMFQTAKLESLGVIAGGVAHDFNNILTGILGNIDLVAQNLPQDSAAGPYLGRVADAACRAADLNRQLLAYAGMGRFVVRPINLNTLVMQTLELVRHSLPKKVEVRFEQWPRLPDVHGDESQMQQVLMNLIINAGEAIGDRPGMVTLQTAVAEGVEFLPEGLPAGRYVTVGVTDTGCGMNEATRARVYEPFFTTKFTGRGLGLAAVRGIVRGHGGAMTLDTGVGRGTTFTLFLPEFDRQAGHPAAEQSAAGIDQHPTPRPGVRKNTMLVVDDDDAVRELTVAILQQLGWNVLVGANGQAGVELFRDNADTIACAVLDLTMPVMDGLEAMACMRLIRPRLPVLICTGYTEESVPSVPSAAPTAILLKPFRPAQLEAALAELFAAPAAPSGVL